MADTLAADETPATTEELAPEGVEVTVTESDLDDTDLDDSAGSEALPPRPPRR